VSKGTPVVAAQRLTKVFRDFWMRSRAHAVDDLTFTIEPHEVFGLLGPNGSGKSTTIKMILGLLKPTKGRLAVFGKPATDVAIKERIGYLPEESFLYPFLNARETLDYYAKLFHIHGKTRVNRIDELLDMVGLTAAQFRPVREYSKGMQRRIGLAQALINDPDFLILDEPTTGLDPLGTRQVKDLIIELGRRGKTVLLSSHLLADVEDCVDRMTILYGGQKRDEGDTKSLLESTTRTTIETDLLDDATIAAIEELVRERSGGEKSILKVSHPRQRLEEKFLDIVERAKADKVKTSGATEGGPTASFLRGDGEPKQDAEQVISGLVASADEPAPPTTQAPSRADGNGPRAGADQPFPSEDDTREDVLGDLLKSDDEPAARAEVLPDEAGQPDKPADDADAEPQDQSPDDQQSKPDADTSGVDLGVIGSLVDDDEERDK